MSLPSGTNLTPAYSDRWLNMSPLTGLQFFFGCSSTDISPLAGLAKKAERRLEGVLSAVGAAYL
jgi:hypothetical protein